MSRWLVRMVLVLAMGSGCAGEETSNGEPSEFALDPNVAPVVDGSWYRPTAATTWQWQLLGTVSTSYDVEAYDVDLFDVPDELVTELHEAGRRVICYFSAGSSENWRPDFGSFAAEDMGEPLDGWEGERWLDVRSATVWAVMMDRLDRALERGCDAVEPDNVDGFDNETGFELTAEDQLAFNRNLANEARGRGLAVGLKNDSDQVDSLLDYYDFCVNEQCHAFDECEPFLAFVEADKPLFNAEYPESEDAASAMADAVCPDALAENARTLILPLDLDDSFRVSCDEWTPP